MRYVLPLLLLLALAACDSGSTASAPKTQVNPALAAQQEKISAIFAQAESMDESDLQGFERLYNQALECCPDTRRVHEAYFLLGNLYLYGIDPPALDKAQALYEQYLERYPDEIPGLCTDFENKLTGIYDRTEQYDKLAALYDKLLAEGLEGCPLSQCDRHLFSYANALERTGRTKDALRWYKAYLEHDPSEVLMDVAEEAIARLEGAGE